ncbi:hypothetical protein IFT92_26765 [Peribacillus simplex]|nr:hypothetical protein [Peribacillus simplex]MBD8591341.1 hypothetical protein [Peribacillus simplex]
MITLMLANHDWEWKFEEVSKICAIRNLCTEDTELRISWYKKALLEAAGIELTQNYLKDCINRAAFPNLDFLISDVKKNPSQKNNLIIRE